MSAAPRLLPMVAVAMGGVLALKALAGAQALPDLLAAASAHAEEAPRAGKPARRGAPADALPAATPPPVAAPPRPAPACIQSPAELAREVGVSPGELQTLQNLQARRGQLDDRERALDVQLQLIAAAEAKVDAKLKAVSDVKAQVQTLLGQAGQQQQAEVDRLVVVYEKMKPRDAAAVMAALDDRVRLPVAAKLKPAVLAAILGQMPTAQAKALTEALATRGDAARQALAAASAPAAPPAATPQSSDPLAPPLPAKPRKGRGRRAAGTAQASAAPVASGPSAAPAASPPQARPTA